MGCRNPALLMQTVGVEVYYKGMGGLSKRSRSLKLKMKRERHTKLRQLKSVYKKLAATERAAVLEKAHRIAPNLNAEAYLKD